MEGRVLEDLEGLFGCQEYIRRKQVQKAREPGNIAIGAVGQHLKMIILLILLFLKNKFILFDIVKQNCKGCHSY